MKLGISLFVEAFVDGESGFADSVTTPGSSQEVRHEIRQ
jgi:hypothetical protein